MLSVLISSRVKYNLDTNIKNLLDSALAFVSPEDYPKIEFLIKYDNDDDHRPSADFFAQYPFVIKTFVYERGEGRHYNHHFSEYLFANRNTNFKWVMSMADDFYFIRKDFLKDLEQMQDEYMVVGYTRPNFEINAVKRIYDENFPYNFDHEKGVGEFCPCLTANLVEICQNMGWQANIDAWVVLLETKLFELYEFLLWRQVSPFYVRSGDYGLGDTPLVKGGSLYNNMSITGARLPQNKYLFKLIEQQAKNIYLNIVYGKLPKIPIKSEIIDPKVQEDANWKPWDAPRYHNPPVFEWYQLKTEGLPTGCSERLVYEDDEYFLYEVNLKRGEKFLFKRRKVESIQVISGICQAIKYVPENHRIEGLDVLKTGDIWDSNCDENCGILASLDVTYLEMVVK